MALNTTAGQKVTATLTIRRNCTLTRARTFKYLWGPGIDSKELIPLAYVAWRDRYENPIFLLGA
jgi:hypothetical protein